MSDNKFKVLTQHDHILKRPGMYVGSVEPKEYSREVLTMNGPRHVKTMMSEALLKIIDEPLANAADASQNDPGANKIKVTTDKRDNSIKIVSNTKFKIEYIPDGEAFSVELAVSRFLSGTNFEDNEESFKLGQNGIGVKATNVFSKYFSIVVHDPSTHQSYYGVWRNNMFVLEKSIVKKSSHKTPYVEIVFIPDLNYFGLPQTLDDDQWDLINSLVFDLSVTAPSHTSVFLNDEKIPFKGIKGYIQAVMGDQLDKIVMDKVEVDGKLRFEVGVTVAPKEYSESIVFVNGARTVRGSIHEYILKKIASVLSKKHQISVTMIKGLLFIVAEAWIPNARFTSQTKTELYTSSSKYGFVWNPNPNFVKGLAKTDLYSTALAMLQEKDDKKAQKEMKVGKHKIPQFSKYDAATKLYKINNAQLILTEGDSAKQLAMAGRSAIKAADSMGLYPLRGKLMNTSKYNLKRLAENKEVSELIQITGITPFKKYDLESARQLPYRHIVLFTDQDVDGSHIAGLCIQLFMNLVPTLLDVYPDYIKRFASPILKILSGKYTGTSFYTEAEYKKFLDKNPDAKSAKVKYYKGLGTSTDADAKKYFEHWDENVIVLKNNGAPSKEAVALAFDETKADERRRFLTTTYDENAYIEYSNKETTIERFIYDDLMHFSNADTKRSIPSMIDGLKVSQRKVTYYARKHVTVNEMKVAQMAGSAAQDTQYHHGEVSLANTIIGMAATYTGSSNLPVLYPSGQFGSRHARNSAAAPRYIYTRTSMFMNSLFKKDDDDVLTYNVDENKQIEPTVFVPVIPLVLVNGANGIGTGWRSDVPQYNPLEIIDECKLIASGKDSFKTNWVPWYAGYNGTMEPTQDGYISTGRYTVSGSSLIVSELPIGKATDDWLDSIQNLVPQLVKNYDKNLGPDSIEVKFNLVSPINDLDIVSTFKLRTKLNTNRMFLFNSNNRVQLYEGPSQIIKEHAAERLKLYEKSRLAQIKNASTKMDLLNNKVRYIMEIINGNIVLGKLSTITLNEYLSKHGYSRFNNSFRYLTDEISTGQLTTDNVEKLKQQMQSLSFDIDKLREESPHTMWLSDLNSLRKHVSEYMDDRLRALDDIPSVPKAKKMKK